MPNERKIADFKNALCSISENKVRNVDDVILELKDEIVCSLNNGYSKEHIYMALIRSVPEFNCTNGAFRKSLSRLDIAK